MSKLSREDILKLARLSRLQLSKAEVDAFVDEISSVLQFTEQLQKIDLDGVAPTYQVSGLSNVTRPDQVIDYGPTTADLLKNAPNLEDGHFKVKRMLA